jgi:predicted nucleotide-binding protein
LATHRPTSTTPSLDPAKLARSRSEVAEELIERIRVGKEILSRTILTADDLGAYGADTKKWMEYNYDLLNVLFTNADIAREYRSEIPKFLITHDYQLNFRNSQTKTITQITKLESILGRLNLYPEAEPEASRGVEAAVREDRSKVFVVHGHDEGTREAVARFIQGLGFQPIILHERANEGRTVIEKVEAHGGVGFAVVLLTPDDEGCVKGGTPGPRARQNVVLELGYFVGRLGRNRVCALKRGELEIPSDFGGVVYEPFDAAGGWKQKLGRELQAAGYEIDWNTVMRA